MKTILVIEDTPVNMETAKSFFSSIDGYNFIYAMDRQSGIKLYPTADAVITDRSIPQRYGETPIKRFEWCQQRGYYFLAKSFFDKKPCVMITQHSDNGNASIKEFSNVSYGDDHFFLKELSKPISTEEYLEMIEKGEGNQTLGHEEDEDGMTPGDMREVNANEFFVFHMFNKITHFRLEDSLTKRDEELWRITWEKLLEKM